MAAEECYREQEEKEKEAQWVEIQKEAHRQWEEIEKEPKSARKQQLNIRWNWKDITPASLQQQCQIPTDSSNPTFIEVTPLEVNPTIPDNIPKTKKLGRPRKIQTDGVIRICELLHFRVSSSAAGAVLNCMFNDKFEVYCRSSVERMSVEGYLCLKHQLAHKLSNSQHLFFTSDGAGAKRGRDFIGMKVGGLDEDDEEVWIQTAIWSEKIEKMGAKEELALLKNFFEQMGEIQRKNGWRVTKLYHLESCVYDNASVNTGVVSGLGVLIEEERKRLWQDDGEDLAKLPPLVTMGCTDHVIDLVEKNYSRFLQQSNDIDTKCVDRLMKHVASFVSGWRSEISAFVRDLHKNESSKKDRIEMESNKDMRFVLLVSIARNIYEQWYPIICWYIISWCTLTLKQKEDFRLLCKPSVQNLIQSRALCADILSFSVMRDVPGITAKDYSTYIKGVLEKVEQGITNPNTFIQTNSYSREVFAPLYSKYIDSFTAHFNEHTLSCENGLQSHLPLIQTTGIEKLQELHLLIVVPFLRERPTLSRLEGPLKNFLPAHSPLLTPPHLPPTQPKQLIAPQPSHSVNIPPPVLLLAPRTFAVDTFSQIVTRSQTIEITEKIIAASTRSIYDHATESTRWIAAYLGVFKLMVEKHISRTLEIIDTLELDITTENTNRTSERLIAEGKNILTGNVATRALLILARIALREASVQEIRESIQLHSEQWKLCTLARQELDGQPRKKEIEDRKYQARKKLIEEKTDKLNVEEKVLRDLVGTYLTGVGHLKVGKKLTKEVMGHFLESQGQNISQLTKVSDFLLACEPYLTAFITSMTKRVQVIPEYVLEQ